MIDKNYIAVPTLMSIDLKNGLIAEGFEKLIDFNENTIHFLAKNRKIYINGTDLYMTSLSKTEVYIKGYISKIEIFEVK